MPKTKYIIHGGNTTVDNVTNKSFFKEILDGLDSPIKLLLVYFSRERSEWPKLLEQDKMAFEANNPDKQIQIYMANNSSFVFNEQIKVADVVYLRGGDTNKLITTLKSLDNITDHIKGKVVVGSSAGAYAISKYYYSESEDRFGEGLGLLNVKVMCHYHGEIKNKYEELKEYGDDIPVYSLRETEYKVIED